MFDRANEQERLFGLRLDGVWMHVGTPDAVQSAEEAFLEKRGVGGHAREGGASSTPTSAFGSIRDRL